MLKISEDKKETAAELVETKPVLKMDKNYNFRAPEGPNHIIIVGCGGTGSYVIPSIARLLYTLRPREVRLTLIDADVVEEKNIIRQNFSPGDVGKNKAEALAARYSGAFGLNIATRDKYLETEEDIQDLFNSAPGGVLVISCVDNIRTRLSISNAVARSRTDKTVYWIDTGNEEESGQVVLAANIKNNLLAGTIRPIAQGEAFNLPDIFDIYPELKERAKLAKFTSQLSCAEMAESAPQYGFVNHNAANFALNFAFDVIKQNPIKVNVVEFSIKNKVAHKSLARSEMLKWQGLRGYTRNMASFLS